jgi:rod shape-determining protein MreC
VIQPYRQKRSYTLAIVLILLALLVSFSTFYNLLGLRQLLQAGLAPVQSVSTLAWRGTLGLPSGLIGLLNLSRQNRRLQAENDLLKAQQSRLDQLSEENSRLRKLLGFSQNHLSLRAAQVIGKGPAPWLTILEINQGSRAGVRQGLAVVAPEGLVGQVIEVAPFSAKVRLLTDPESSVASTVSRSREFGVVEGDPSGTLLMKYVSATGELKEGDAIVTSGLSTLFPSALTIGTVIRAQKREQDLFYEVKVKPAVNFSSLEEVFLVY